MNGDKKENDLETIDEINGIKRPQRPTAPGRHGRHKRNPSIRTLLNSKRYQQATPKHEMMDRIFFSPHGPDNDNDIDNGNENETKIDPKIERLNSSFVYIKITTHK